MEALARSSIQDLNPGSKNVLLVGVVIGAQHKKVVSQKRTLTPVDHYTFTFTVKDCNGDSINVSCSGLVDYITSISDTCKIGHVVEIHQPTVVPRQLIGYEAENLPDVTCSFKLLVDEKSCSAIYPYDCEADDPVNEQLHLAFRTPFRSSYGCVSVDEVFGYPHGTILDVVGVLVEVGEPRSFTGKDGNRFSVLEVTLAGTNQAISVSVWENELQEAFLAWGSCVVYMACVKVSEDQFRNRKTLSTMRQSICTPEPDMAEADDLMKAVEAMDETGDLQNLLQKTATENDVSQFKTTVTVDQLKKQIDSMMNSSATGRQTTLVKLDCYVEQLLLDDDSSLCRFRCPACNSRSNSDDSQPATPNCTTVGCKRRGDQMMPELDLRLSLIDATGSFQSCRVSGETAERLVAIKADSLIAPDEGTLTLLRMGLLMEFFQIGVKIVRHNGGVSVYVIDMKK